MSFAENIQYLRKRDKLTQEELAEKLDVSRQSVSKWETGEAFPETEKLILLCDTFDVKMDDLMRGDVTKGVSAGGEANGERAGAKREEANKKAKFYDALEHALSLAIMLLAAVIYVTIGCVWGIWHPSWIVFLVASFIDAAFAIIFSILKGKAGVSGQSEDNLK